MYLLHQRGSPKELSGRASRSSSRRAPSLARYLANSAMAGATAVCVLVVLSSAQAQPVKLPVIGVLSPFVDADSRFLTELRDGLSDRGLREGQEIAIEYRSAEGRIDRMSLLADELVSLRVDIIVTASAPAIRFVQRATQNIPIVMAQV